MKIFDIIQPVLSVKEHELLKRASRIHEDPEIHTNPERQRMIFRLMRMGLLRQIRGDSMRSLLPGKDTRYEVTEKGKVLLK